MLPLREDGEVLLEPGDILMIQYIVATNPVEAKLAVHEIKQALANDARFNYQGSEIVTETYADNSELKLLNIYVQVRKTPKQQKQAEQATPQEANMFLVIAIAAGTVIAFIKGAQIAHSGTIIYRLWVLNGIITSDMTADEQRVAIAAVNATNSAKAVGVGEAVRNVGISMGVIAVVIGGLWLLTQRRENASL